MTLKRNFAENEYYHIYNRGAFKQTLFRDKGDYIRFLFSIIHNQSPILFPNPHRLVKQFSPTEGFALPADETNDIMLNRFVELTTFCIMPNHYHLIVKEVVEGGISRYLQRIGDGYTRYFNIRYQTSGCVFQDTFQSRHIADNNYLLYLSAYIHRNPRELKQWKNKEFEYPWSSLQDFTEGNRWGGLLMSDIIADQFDATSNSNYKDFVKTSTAKMLEKELGGNLLTGI